jgi:hypothetical protein
LQVLVSADRIVVESIAFVDLLEERPVGDAILEARGGDLNLRRVVRLPATVFRASGPQAEGCIR